MITGTEVGTGIGAIAAMGFILKFLVSKLGKKQDKEMCKVIKTNFEKALGRGEKKFGAIMSTQTAILNTQTDILVSLEGITTELKHLNGKTK